MWYYINKFFFLTSITLDIWILLFEGHSFLKYKLLQRFFGQVVKFHWKSEWLFSNRLKKEGVFIQITHEKAQLLLELIIFARLKSTSFKLILIINASFCLGSSQNSILCKQAIVYKFLHEHCHSLIYQA